MLRLEPVEPCTTEHGHLLGDEPVRERASGVCADVDRHPGVVRGVRVEGE